MLEDGIADQAKGGLGNYHTPRCLTAGMPLIMIAFRPLEFVVTPATTYILIGDDDHHRRIFTDGRSLAQRARADVCRLLCRQMDRRGRRRPLRRARSRDARSFQESTGTLSISSARTACLCQRAKISLRRTCNISNSHRNSDDRSDTHRASRRGGLITLGRHRTIPRTSARKVVLFKSYVARATL